MNTLLRTVEESVMGDDAEGCQHECDNRLLDTVLDFLAGEDGPVELHTYPKSERQDR